MNINDQQLAHILKLKFGTAPHEPTQQQLDLIKRDIKILAARSGTPSEIEWFNIIKRHCPGAGTHGYMGRDDSDLITLLRLATKQN